MERLGLYILLQSLRALTAADNISFYTNFYSMLVIAKFIIFKLKLRRIFFSFEEFYLSSTFNLTELVDQFFVETMINKNGTKFNVFWYESYPINRSMNTADRANRRKLFLPIDQKDWITKVGKCYS